MSADDGQSLNTTPCDVTQVVLSLIEKQQKSQLSPHQFISSFNSIDPVEFSSHDYLIVAKVALRQDWIVVARQWLIDAQNDATPQSDELLDDVITNNEEQETYQLYNSLCNDKPIKVNRCDSAWIPNLHRD